MPLFLIADELRENIKQKLRNVVRAQLETQCDSPAGLSPPPPKEVIYADWNLWLRISGNSDLGVPRRFRHTRNLLRRRCGQYSVHRRWQHSVLRAQPERHFAAQYPRRTAELFHRSGVVRQACRPDLP